MGRQTQSYPAGGTDTTSNTYLERLQPYLIPGAGVRLLDGMPAAEIRDRTEVLEANAYYFGKLDWMEGWLKYVHRYPELRERWHATAGSWDGKVVVDIGCGPGNLLKNLGDAPAIAIGVDVARGSLEIAKGLGYVPLLADAHDLPLKSEIADVIALNGTLHHCEDMDKVLLECARLVKPGGVLVIDHDPQMSAWDYRWLGMAMWKIRKPIYRWMKRGGHRAEGDEQSWAERTEIHHRPGDGLTEEMLREPLERIGFEVRLFPHNHTVGGKVLEGDRGRSPFKLRFGQMMSGINPDSRAGALSLMCVAVKRESAAGAH